VADLKLNPCKQAIGEGSFGKVLSGKLHGKHVAVKKPKASQLRREDSAIVNELRVLRHVRHRNIVFFFGAIILPDTGTLALVFEHVRGNTLRNHICSLHANQDYPGRLLIAEDLCCALRYLHGQNPCIIHGDLKPSNVMIEAWADGPHAKLLDFGLSCLKTKNAEPLGGTWRWMAPEVLLGVNKSPASCTDVYSFGWVLIFVLTGTGPLEGWAYASDVAAFLRAGIPILPFGHVVRPCVKQETVFVGGAFH